MKANPYDWEYVMKRDACSKEQALDTISKLKEKSAWNRGKKIKKSNPYDPEYVMKRDACSQEQALATISKFKADKATSQANFIKKYGNEEGTRRYNNWKSKSLQKGWDTVKKNGRSQSPRCKEYYIRKGHTPEDAVTCAIEFQHKNSPMHIQYYLDRGKSFDYAKRKIREIHDQKIGIDSYRQYLEKTTLLNENEINHKIKENRGHNTINNLGENVFKERQSKIRKTLEENGIWVPYCDLSNYKKYHKEVWKYTNQHDLNLLVNYEKRGRAGINNAYHLDHKFSISRGFIEGIDPALLGSLQNLEFIPWEDNVSKQGKCSITKEELLK
jgi:hypothetical protein